MTDEQPEAAGEGKDWSQEQLRWRRIAAAAAPDGRPGQGLLKRPEARHRPRRVRIGNMVIYSSSAPWRKRARRRTGKVSARTW